jgi:hypothetical protein
MGAFVYVNRGERAAVWVTGDTLTIEYATAALAQYQVTVEADGRRIRDVTEPGFFATAHGSPQPFLPVLDEVAWEPAQRLPPYRARSVHAGASRQEHLFDLEENDATASAAHCGEDAYAAIGHRSSPPVARL